MVHLVFVFESLLSSLKYIHFMFPMPDFCVSIHCVCTCVCSVLSSCRLTDQWSPGIWLPPSSTGVIDAYSHARLFFTWVLSHLPTLPCQTFFRNSAAILKNRFFWVIVSPWPSIPWIFCRLKVECQRMIRFRWVILARVLRVRECRVFMPYHRMMANSCPPKILVWLGGMPSISLCCKS